MLNRRADCMAWLKVDSGRASQRPSVRRVDWAIFSGHEVAQSLAMLTANWRAREKEKEKELPTRP